MSELTICDQVQRERAIDPRNSFIVQAPAGSGKTGLLVQRILILLARVSEPEEIIAITFTRKAAAEMRDRIVKALELATDDVAPKDAYLHKTWELARQALAQDRQQCWDLLANPSRLRIQTIDALCASLVSQMPLLSKFGALPHVIEDAGELYRQAAKHTIDELETTSSWSDAIGHLLAHLDNRPEYLQALICNMLAKREQWLRHVADPAHPSIDRNSLESALQGLLETSLLSLQACWPQSLNSELEALLGFSIQHLDKETTLSQLFKAEEVFDFPAADIDDLPAWQGLADFLLTAEGSVRKSVTRTQGFPPQSAAASKSEQAQFAEMKERMQALLQALHAYPQAVSALQQVRHLPEPRYSEDEWQTLCALFELLRLSAAHLELLFAQTGQVDFTAMSRAALEALGQTDQPTDLALTLDYRISHILVDEFQDTSQSQFDLLTRLTAGWQQGDDRTLFLVGDPMQSIYRFREAEVGLFLEAWQYGLGEIVLEPLHLEVNFRSQAGIIDWVNACFRQCLPGHDDMETGAVSYVDSTAVHPHLSGPACETHPFFGNRKAEEAKRISSIVTQSRQQNPQASIAILVRSRTHLIDIVQVLRETAVSFRAVEIEALSERPLIKDLLALFKALSNPADRIAWLGILRAPWCGMELSELHRLSVYDKNRTIAELIDDDACFDMFSGTARLRLERVAKILTDSLEQAQRKGLRDWIEGCWYLLGGPACINKHADLEDAEVFFQLLESLESINMVDTNRELFRAVEKLFALPDKRADASLQIMTMHKSKGLEFDVVILPGLGQRPANDDSDLIKWLERPRRPAGNDLLMAPIKQSGGEVNRKYSLLSHYEKQKALYENGRLLYVACTRARQYLHLLGHVNCVEKKQILQFNPPVSNTLLASLWPAVCQDFEQAFALMQQQQGSILAQSQPTQDSIGLRQSFSRLVAHWVLPEPPTSCQVRPARSLQQESMLEFDWASETARHIGTVVHEVLQHVSKLPATQWADIDTEGFRDRCRYLLMQQGLDQDGLDASSDVVVKAIRNCVDDPRGRWILDSGHKQAYSEYALTGLVDNSARHVIIDRTFIDEQGIRWIIDYKTGSHSGAGLEEFLDREMLRYRQQLETYAEIMRYLDKRPIKLGLYFPLLQAWRAWPYQG